MGIKEKGKAEEMNSCRQLDMCSNKVLSEVIEVF